MFGTCGNALDFLQSHLMQLRLHITHIRDWFKTVHGLADEDASLAGHAIAAPSLNFIPYIWQACVFFGQVCKGFVHLQEHFCLKFWIVCLHYC